MGVRDRGGANEVSVKIRVPWCENGGTIVAERDRCGANAIGVDSFHADGNCPLMGTDNYSAIANNMMLVRWPLMDGLLHLVQ